MAWESRRACSAWSSFSKGVELGGLRLDLGVVGAEGGVELGEGGTGGGDLAAELRSGPRVAPERVGSSESSMVSGSMPCMTR